MFGDIPNSDTWTVIEKINKGWSSDTKYYIETIHNQKLLLRVSNIDQYESKKKEYDIIRKYAQLAFKMSEPIEFGVCNDHQQVYMLLTWVEGEDLKDALPKLDEARQYALGVEAGRILKQIHSLPVPASEMPTETKIPRKKQQLQSYIDSNVRVAGDEPVIQFAYAHMDKMWSKPPVYQHGDFHPGNLILTPDGTIGVIDFNRWEIGDPYEEFYKLEIFGNKISIPYCIGQINSYFENNVPEQFWEILAVYTAHSSLFSIKWAEPFGQAEIDNMTAHYYSSLQHFDHYKKVIPSWYTASKGGTE